MEMTIEVTAQNFDEEVLNYKGKVLVDFGQNGADRV